MKKAKPKIRITGNTTVIESDAGVETHEGVIAKRPMPVWKNGRLVEAKDCGPLAECTSIKDQRDAIVADISDITGIHPNLLYSRRRYEHVANARFLVYFLLYQNGWSLTAIARSFPIPRDHGTILHGINAVVKEHKHRGMAGIIRAMEGRGYQIWLRSGIH